MPERSQPNIPVPGTYPSTALLRRWKSMPPWKAQRERARWWAEQGQQDPHVAAVQEQAKALAAPDSRPSTRRRLTNEELVRRAGRRAELDDPAFDGTVTAEDLEIASPATVTRLMNSGVLQRDLGGPPPQKQYGTHR
jgi:hypothetical protein